MQLHATEQFSLGQSANLPKPHNSETRSSASGTTDSYSSPTEAGSLAQLTRFRSEFTGCMTLHADAQTVAQYLDAHHGWFCRCAQPMKVEFLGNNGYDLTIGRFGAFGYQVEPKIGLELLPQDQGIYRVRTMPLPPPEFDSEDHRQSSETYKVDFQSVLRLVEAPVESPLPAPAARPTLTQVEWHLELTVLIQFPGFIHRLPQRLIQSTGDRLLTQIVRQVSHRLTAKVQEDFHASLGLPLPQPCLHQP